MCNFTNIHDNSGHFPSRMSNAELFGIFKKAAKLTKDPCNGCRTVVSQRHFALSPRYLGRLKKGAMETLESEIGHYSESLGGVPLAYCNLQLLQQTGNILDDQPFIHFNVSFKAVIFQPAIGSILKCVVNEFAADHVSCLVHNWFNLSLPLRGDDAQERLPKGSKVMTKVTKIQAKNGILAIQATPTEERFSDLQLVEPMPEEQSDEDEAIAMEVDGAVSRKVKHDSGFGSDPDNSIGLPLESTSDNDGENVGSKKKKKKKRGEQEMDDSVVKEEPDHDVIVDEGLVEMTEEPGREGKKKKKKKKDRMKEKEIEDSPETVSVKQEPELFSDERNVINGAGDGSNIEQQIEKKKKKKRKSGVVSDSSAQESIAVKTEELDSEESILDVNLSRKKSKKKRKERDSEGAGIDTAEEEVKRMGNLMIKDEIESDSEQTPQRKAKSKKHKHKDGSHQEGDDAVTREKPNNEKEKQKHLKRKHSDMSDKVNGDSDHSERTTQNEVYGTEEDIDGAPPKKKKKKKKHIKEEVV